MTISSVYSNNPTCNPIPRQGTDAESKIRSLEQKIQRLTTAKQKAVQHKDEEQKEKLEKQIEKLKKQIQQLRQQENGQAREAAASNTPTPQNPAENTSTVGKYIDVYA